MRLPFIRYLVLALLIAGIGLCYAAVPAYAVPGGHDEGGKLEHVVDLEGKTGANLFLARIYNENRLLYAIVVTATMAFLGIVVGRVTEFILKLIGIK